MSIHAELNDLMARKGYSQTKIAQELGVNRSTASREIHRGSVLQIVAGKTVKRHFAETAQSIADASKANVGRKPKFFTCGKFIEYADALMKEEGFSPDAVVGQALDLELFRPEEMVCTNTLYRYIDSGILTTKNIDLTQKLSRKLRNVYARENKRVFGKSIDERPAEINDFWVNAYPEIDTIPGQVAKIHKAGYLPVATFILPENCWTEHYFAAKIEAQKIFLHKYAGNKIAEEFSSLQFDEEELYSKYKAFYGYTFFIAKKIEQ